MIEGTARKTSLENKHLRNFPIIQSCSHSTMLRLSNLVRIRQCWRSTLLMNRLARRWIKCRELKSYGRMLKLSPKPQTWQLHVVVLLRMARSCSKSACARAARLLFLIRPTKFFIWHAVIAISISDTKALGSLRSYDGSCNETVTLEQFSNDCRK